MKKHMKKRVTRRMKKGGGTKVSPDGVQTRPWTATHRTASLLASRLRNHIKNKPTRVEVDPRPPYESNKDQIYPNTSSEASSSYRSETDNNRDRVTEFDNTINTGLQEEEL